MPASSSIGPWWIAGAAIAEAWAAGRRTEAEIEAKLDALHREGVTRMLGMQSDAILHGGEAADDLARRLSVACAALIFLGRVHPVDLETCTGDKSAE